MQIISCELKNFRCFTSYTGRFEKPCIVIEGANGTGKTSLLEAFAYGCYLKSFRTTTTEELITHAQDTFFIKIDISNRSGEHTIALGYNGTQRLVKIDGKIIKSYRDLLDEYRVITIMEDDIDMIQGAPENRRMFVDQACALSYATYTKQLALYRKLLKQRNALLANKQLWNQSSYEVWTEQLMQAAASLLSDRIQLLQSLTTQINQLINHYMPELGTVICLYQHKQEYESLTVQQLIERFQVPERAAGRTLFGPHLDDVIITRNGVAARSFASRGQQKLISVLIKIASFKILQEPAIILLDDFITDFDEQRLAQLITLLLQLQTQLIFTVPTHSSKLTELLAPVNPLLIRL